MDTEDVLSDNNKLLYNDSFRNLIGTDVSPTHVTIQRPVIESILGNVGV